MQLFSAVLSSIPGIGPVYNAGILAEIADISRFKNHAALAQNMLEFHGPDTNLVSLNLQTPG